MMLLLNLCQCMGGRTLCVVTCAFEAALSRGVSQTAASSGFDANPLHFAVVRKCYRRCFPLGHHDEHGSVA